MMLEELDTIDWKSLKHCFGTAEEVPNLIRSLVSDDKHEIEEAYSKLSQLLYHQTTVSEAGVASIPFLVQILQLGYLNSSAGIMNLLIEMSHGTEWSRRTGWWRTEADEIVRRYVSVYLSQLNHPDPVARFNAIRILCDSPLYVEVEIPTILQRLIDQYSVEPDEFNKAAIILRIGYLFEGSGQYLETQRSHTADFIESIYKSSNDELRLVSSFTLPILLRAQTPAKLVDDLVELVANPPQRITRSGKPTLAKIPLGTIGGGVNRFALVSLWYLDHDTRLTALEKAMERTSDVRESLGIASALMHWTFVGNTPEQPSRAYGKRPDGTRGYTFRIYVKHKDIDDLSKIQKRVLKVIINCDKVWATSSNLLEAYGFPANRDELRHLLNSD